MFVRSLHRHPVKSMLGESRDVLDIDVRGVMGDRAFAVIDATSGLVASAKQPVKWGQLLQCSARWSGQQVVIRFPDGTEVGSDDPAVDRLLTELCDREARLSSVPPPDPHLERLWPDVDGLAPAELVETARVTSMGAAAPGSFLDFGPVHILTTSSLSALGVGADSLAAAAARFRPNILLETDEPGFVENEWAGRQLRVGEDVVLEVLTPTPRCAVPSLAHGSQPQDLGVLRSVVARNRLEIKGGRYGCLGVYARVVSPGRAAAGDVVRG